MIAAVAVVAQAVMAMMRALAPDRARATLAVVATVMVLALPPSWGQFAAIVFGGLIGLVLLRGPVPDEHPRLPHPVSRTAAIAALVLFFAMLIGLPLLTAAVPSHALQLFDAFYRAGSLVFGGGHVVLPLLQAAVVPPGWVGNDAFLAGYGAAQAVPGPLFTFSAYLGTVMHPSPNGWTGAILCLVAMFLPTFLLVIGPLPFWDELRRRSWAQAMLRRQCRRGRTLARGAVPSGLDLGDHQCRRFRVGCRRLPAAVHVEDAALAGGRLLRHRRRSAAARVLGTFVYFRSSTRGRLLLQFDLIVINSGTDEIF
jgi:putative chromate ion transporter